MTKPTHTVEECAQERHRIIQHEFTHAYLKSVLKYEPETGEFFWLVTKGGKAKKGTKAGSFTARGYGYIKVGIRSIGMHRLAWFYANGYWPGMIDHINRNPRDNRLCNLREVSKSINNANRLSTSSSGHRGVNWSVGRNGIGKWHAVASWKNKNHSFGYYFDIDEAIKATEEGRKKLYGDLYTPPPPSIHAIAGEKK